MTSLPMRNPMKDHLLTSKNAALILIDYQPLQIYTVKSMEAGKMINNVVTLAKVAKTFDLPIILSTVNVTTGMNPDTIPQLKRVLSGMRSIDRTQINAWEDAEFLEAVKATGRRKLIIGALWTEACLLFPTLDALSEGFEMYPVIDVVGSPTMEAHKASFMRMCQAGAKPTSWNSVMCELQRDWARKETARDFLQLAIDQHMDWGWYEEFRGTGQRQGELVGMR